MHDIKSSHKAHSEWYEKVFTDQEARLKAIDDWKRDQKNDTIPKWLHQRLLQLTEPFVNKNHSWLTVGDGYGFDAHYLLKKNQDATASDISDTFLPLVKQQGIITKYTIENAESLSFPDNSFDYTLCKEAYHHFPRPYLAVYEMIRVAREAVILIEPQDPVTRMPLLLAFCNLMDRLAPRYTQQIWKNRYSFETVGNFVFKLSEREMTKLANGIGLPAVAFKSINNNFYHPEIAGQKADRSSKVFKKIKRKLWIQNFLSGTTLVSPDVLCAVIFKKLPSGDQLQQLKEDGFIFHRFPANPYL